MVYFKIVDADGFVTASTLNADEGGNSTKAEHDTIVEMLVNAEAGYGVMETESGFVYAMRPVPEPSAPTAEDILDTLFGGDAT